MDRNLIVPPPDLSRRFTPAKPVEATGSAATPDHHWHFSKIHDPRRSTGEKELLWLSGKSLLLPLNPAFHPDGEGLSWRVERLIA
jgi:hypothetical protein